MSLVLLVALVAAAQAPVDSLDARWVVSLDTPTAAPAGYDATSAYVPLKSGQVVAIDLDRGVIRWQRELATTFTPATGDGLVFLASDGQIEALDATTGGSRWRTTVPGRLAVPPAWDTGWLLAATAAGDFVALRAADGTVVWRKSLGAAPSRSAAPGLDRLFVPLADGRLISMLLASGELVWEQRLDGTVTSLAAIGDQLIVGTTGNAVRSLDIRRGYERWRWRVGGVPSGDATADDRRIFFVSRDNILKAVDRRSGNLRWTANLDSRPVGGPTLLDGVVLVPMANEVVALDPATGTAVAHVKAVGELSAPPHLRAAGMPTGARLVTTTRDGRLHGFGDRFEPAPAPLETLPGTPVSGDGDAR